jgi:hypothetical protein
MTFLKKLFLKLKTHENFRNYIEAKDEEVNKGAQKIRKTPNPGIVKIKKVET